jgi:hypothetical protein
MKIRTCLVTAAVLAATVPTVSAGAAQAKSGDDNIRTGSCSGSTHWKMKAKPDDGRIEVESEIDSNHAGQTWHWVLRHNGSVSARGSAVTRGPSGSFDVERRTVNAAGADHFTFRARRGSGEVCRAHVNL